MHRHKVRTAVSQIDTYDTFNGVQTSGTRAKYNASGLQTEADVYDFGTSSRGNLLWQEKWTYGYSIAGFPTNDEIYDGSNNLAGRTTYTYDGASVVTSSGVPQHVAVTGVRGNLTTSNFFASAGTSYPVTATYEDTGSQLTSTSPNGTSTLSYDSTFTLLTGVSLPTPSSGVALQNTAGYDTSYTALPLVSTDPNLQPTHYSYDSMLRPIELDFPDGGKTTLSYPSATDLVLQPYQSASVNGNTSLRYDGYRRQSRVATYNGQGSNPWYQNDTCYDANGNASFISYRYQGAGFVASKVCSGSGQSVTYDVLGRVLTVAQSTGETRTFSYAGRTMKSVDENGVTRISQIDGLGRTAGVCEISSNSNMPGSGSPTSCGMDIAGTGFKTDYSYDVANHKITITQGSQTRIFQTDWLGRTILIQEPESGATTYSYSYNSTGLVATRVRPRANQTGGATTTTTTQYDTLGRVVSVNYDDQLTPNKVFVYDVSSQWTNFPQTNLKGRLSVAYTPYAPPATPTTGTTYSYDAMGRVAALGKCLPSGCGNGAKDIHLLYTYDWLGNVLSAGDGGGVTTFYNSYSPANEVGTITTSLSDATHPGTLVSNIVYGPFGPQSYHLGNGLNVWHPYDSLGRPMGEWVCTSTPSMGCGGDTYQKHGVYVGWSGNRVSITEETNDDIPNRVVDLIGYDEFNRMTSMTNQLNNQLLYTYVYDRYGNRWQQNVMAGSGPSPQFSFNPSNNQIVGDGYDAAGNLISDGTHTYNYDAEGNLLKVDNGQTDTYVYDALNEWVRVTIPVNNGQVLEAVHNIDGQRVSWWDGISGIKYTDKHYWDMKPISFDFSDGKAHFEHQNWLGTERMRTSYNGAVDGSYTSLPFGDALGLNSSDQDPYHFAGLEWDTWSNTDHARFRQYTHTQGRWMSPDPYGGSYDFTNPQSTNRYAYVLNNPMSYIDPLGLDYGIDCGLFCVIVVGTGSGNDPTDGSGGLRGGRPAPFLDSPENPYRRRAPSKVVKAICGKVPSGRIGGVVGAAGSPIANAVAGGEGVLNYNSGQTSFFGYAGGQVGCCNDLSGGAYSGIAYGLADDNSNYSGGFSSGNIGIGPVSFSKSVSSNGFSGPFTFPPTGGVTTYAIGMGEGASSQITFFGSATQYSQPIQVGQFAGFGIGDYLLYGARQLCKAAGF